MRSLLTILAFGVFLVVSGCSRSNPLLGKWKLAPNSGNECFQLSEIEFGDKTITMATPLAPVTVAITYSHDGDSYSATLPNGQVLSFQTESGGLSRFLQSAI
jgi:hypothetical protein